MPSESSGNPIQTAVALTLTAGLNQSATLTPDAVPTLDLDASPAAAATVDPGAEPSGKIVYTCQYSKRVGRNQICIINADGSGLRTLTAAGTHDDFFASISPEGDSVLFTSNRTGLYQIYEIDLESNVLIQLTDLSGLHAYAPDVSPDGRYIVFYAREADGVYPSSHNLWLMDRDGSNPHAISDRPGGAWDPAWAPDSEHILFASEEDGRPQLFAIGLDGSNPRQVTDFVGIRGRNDWSPDGVTLSVYIGSNWDWDVYTFDVQGENLLKLTDGDNNLAPSFSPDGQWIAFMSYRDHPLQDLGCEVYIMRVNGTDARRLTDNDICDWQPRWGN